MSWHFSRALVAEYSAATYSDGKQSAQLSANPTPQAYLCKDRMTAFSRLSRFGMTFAPLTENLGEGLLTWFLEDSRVRTYRLPGMVPALMASDQACGERWRESSARYDLGSSSWKTAHSLFQEDLHWSSVTLPKWGMILSGALFQHPTAERPISVTASGLWLAPKASDTGKGERQETFLARMGDRTDRCAQSLAAQVLNPKTWPTPQASDNRDRGNMSTPAIKRRIEKGKQVMLSMSVSEQSGQLNPVWVEWLMGWPLGWTDLKPLEMGRFQEWQQQHSGF